MSHNREELIEAFAIGAVAGVILIGSIRPVCWIIQTLGMLLT